MSEPPASIDENDLDARVRRVDPDRWLSSRFIADPRARADAITLYAFDYELTRAPRTASNPLLGEVRLTWWREVLEEIFEGRPVRHHPTAQALADVQRRRDLDRASLELLIDARYRELDPAPMDPEEALAWARDTGGRMAGLVSGFLDPATHIADAEAGGAAWALSWRAAPELDAARRVSAQFARASARRVSARSFPAIAHAALGADRKGEGEFRRKVRITWAVATGRL